MSNNVINLFKPNSALMTSLLDRQVNLKHVYAAMEECHTQVSRLEDAVHDLECDYAKELKELEKTGTAIPKEYYDYIK